MDARLVETAWQLGIGRGMLAVIHDIPTEEFFVQTPSRRIGLTSSRGALNGYQKGRCFYCFREICVVTSDRLPDVDHFYPLTLTQVDSALTPILNGIWNLVLACRSCNRGTDGKMTRVPDLKYQERLHRRNSFLINSHHPLRDTLMQQTGATEAVRAQFLREMDTNAIKMLIHRWLPRDELPPAF